MKNPILPILAALALTLPVRANDAFEADRRAILSMAGEFAVRFSFRETLPLQPGYQLNPDPYSEEAHELVLVAENSGRRIRLQHLLVADGHVIKHWAQIWGYEDTRLCEFQGHNSWKMRALTADEARGTWTQHVTQVDDSPRYESWGRWQHLGGVSSWTSHDTWRPLPRREHTKRKDYDVVAGTNRHVITPDGWAHEQDNTKTIVRDGRILPLAREAGLNTYRRVTGMDFSSARSLWQRDAEFWNAVVAAWDRVQESRTEIAIADTFDVPALRRAIDELRKQQRTELSSRLADIIGGRLAPAQPTAEAGAPAAAK